MGSLYAPSILSSDVGLAAVRSVLQQQMEAACVVLKTESMWIYEDRNIARIADLGLSPCDACS